MNLTQIKHNKWIYTALAFAFPFLGMLFVMLISQCCPFGKYSYLYSDMYHQYYPFFKDFRRALLSGDSLLYNWSVGLGIDYLGLYSYYLASPLNLLSILVPEGWLLGYFSLLMPIKLGLASLFFSLFLKKIFNKNDISISLFGSFYGLCAWALGYQWNIMWLDTFALLPLVMLGMVSLLRDKKFILYTLTLFLSVAINYYIGLFTCIFVLLTFICYEICRWQSLEKLFRDLGRIAVFSLLAIGMTAFLSLPTLAALQNTQSSVNIFPTGFQLNMTSEDNWLGLLQTIIKVAGNTAGGIKPTFKEGLPNLYSGVFTTVLAFLFLCCKQVRLRDKICAICLLLFLNISCIVRQLDYIWHGFHFTNMIPYRFTFLYSFVMLYMAYVAWTNRKYFQLWQVCLSAVAAILLLLCYEDLTDVAFWAYNGLMLLLYVSVLVYRCVFPPVPENADEEALRAYRTKRIHKNRVCSYIFLGIIGIELVLNLVNFGVNFSRTNISNYPKGTTDTKTVLEHMEALEKDNPFYRVETTHTQTLNDGALNGYYGITTFTSSANVKVTEFMKALGYGAKNTYNRYSFEESSPVSNLFLGLKYMLERDGKVEANPYFEDIYAEGNVHLLENKAYLPLGFLANSQLLNMDFSAQMDRFDFQNTLIRQVAGLDKNVWYILPGTSLTINGNGPSVTPKPATGYCSYSTDENTEGTITYSYTADRYGLMCVNLDLSKKNNFSLWLNGNQLYSETYSLPQMVSVCEVKPGDIVEVQLKCKKSENGTIKISAAILYEAFFWEAYEALSESVLNITSFANTRVEGTIDCAKDGVLYTSIPQNGNWSATVDGKPVETVEIGGAMVGVLLSKGTHNVVFTYRNAAFSLGWKVSVACLVIFIGIALAIYQPQLRRYKGKYSR